MSFEEFKIRFSAAVQMLRDQVEATTLTYPDAIVRQCVCAVGLPSTRPNNLLVWVLLLAALPSESVDPDEIILLSYQLTFPWWKRLWWNMADAYRAIEYSDSEVKLSSSD
ncbi:hypothetical protein K2P47_04875 [Patescibacteria group bacterium]|nr:hypothetical protein [Patescibacteria group bacterium]